MVAAAAATAASPESLCTTALLICYLIGWITLKNGDEERTDWQSADPSVDVGDKRQQEREPVWKLTGSYARHLFGFVFRGNDGYDLLVWALLYHRIPTTTTVSGQFSSSTLLKVFWLLFFVQNLARLRDEDDSKIDFISILHVYNAWDRSQTIADLISITYLII